MSPPAGPVSACVTGPDPLSTPTRVGPATKLLRASGSVVVGSDGSITETPAGDTSVTVSKRLAVTGRASFTATGTVSTTATSRTVTGVGTFFTTQLAVGDKITVNTETLTVLAIASDTSLTVDSGFTGSNSGVSMTIIPAFLRAQNSAGTTFLWSADGTPTLGLLSDANGNPGINATVLGAVNSAVLQGRRGRGSIASPAAAQTGDVLLRVRADGYGATKFSTARATIDFVASETWTDSAHGTYVIISTTAPTTTTLHESVRIDGRGHVGVMRSLTDNAFLYVGSGTGSLTDNGNTTAPTGVASRVDTSGANTCDGAAFNANSVAGTTGSGQVRGSVSRVDLNDTAATGDAVGGWSDIFVRAASARDAWGGNIYATVVAGVAYAGTAVGCEIGCFLENSTNNAGGALHCVVGDGVGTAEAAFVLKLSAVNPAGTAIQMDSAVGPEDYLIWYGGLLANLPSGAPLFSVNANGWVNVGTSAVATNAYVYVGDGTGSLVDATGTSGFRATVNTGASTRPYAAGFCTNVVAGTAAGNVFGSVSRIDLNDTTNTGDAVGLWGDCFVYTATKRNVWGGNIYCQIMDGAAYAFTAVGAEIGLFNWGTTTNPGGSLTLTCNGDTDARFGLYIIGGNGHCQNGILMGDELRGPTTNYFYFGALDATNSPTGTTPKFQGTKTGLLGIGIVPTVGLHQLGGGHRIQALATPGAPTATPKGTAGSTTYVYWVVAEDAAGNRTLNGTSGQTTTGNATLTTANWIQVTWTAVSGAAKYYILRKATAPTAGGAESILLGTWTNAGIQGIAVAYAGAGMSGAPTVSFPVNHGNPGSGATATANVTGTAPNQTLRDVVVTAPGSLYNDNVVVAFTISGLVSPYATSAITGGVVTSVTVVYGGDKFTNVPTVGFSGGGGSGAAGTAVMGVASLTLGAGGTGYTNGINYALAFSGGAGTGATGLFDVVGGAVTNLRVTKTVSADGQSLKPVSGSGYTSQPTVSFAAAGAGSGASATAFLGVASVTITNGGTTYATAPIPTFTVSGVTFPVATTNPTTLEINDSGAALTSFTNALRNGTADLLADGKITAGTSISCLARSAAAQTFTAAATTYVTGSDHPVPSTGFAINQVFEWDMDVSKTGAGTAAKSVLIKIGTAGAVGDTTVLTLALGAGTAAIDTGNLKVRLVIRGPLGGSCLAYGSCICTHNGGITGLIILHAQAVAGITSTFDSSVANLKVGVALTMGASEVWTVQNIVTKGP